MRGMRDRTSQAQASGAIPMKPKVCRRQGRTCAVERNVRVPGKLVHGLRGRPTLVSTRPRALGAEAPPVGTILLLVGMPVGLAAYWWQILVPSERRSLAKSKRKGGLDQYLEGLENDESRGLERWFYTDYLNQREARRAKRAKVRSPKEAKSSTVLGEAPENSVPPLTEEELDLEEDRAAAADPVFLSLDNPIVVVGTLMASFVAFSVLSGR